MDLVSENCEYCYTAPLFGRNVPFSGRNVKLYKSKNGRWLLTYSRSNDSGTIIGVAIDEKEVKKLLLRYDWKEYEKYFGELEEA